MHTPRDPHPDQVEDDNSAAGEEDPGAALDLPAAPATPEDPGLPPATPPDGPVLPPAG